MSKKEKHRANALMLVGLIVGIAASFCSSLAVGSFFHNRTDVPWIVTAAGWIGVITLFGMIYYLFLKSLRAIEEDDDKEVSKLSKEDWEKIADMIKKK